MAGGLQQGTAISILPALICSFYHHNTQLWTHLTLGRNGVWTTYMSLIKCKGCFLKVFFFFFTITKLFWLAVQCLIFHYQVLEIILLR